MAIIAVFDVPGMTSDQYDQTDRELKAAGLGNPDGRLYHIAAAKEGGWFVADLWESGEKMQKFAETLIPILQAAGVTPTEPTIYPVHNILPGS